MTWYAQNQEDQILRRLVGEHDPGWYIDIGAWHPTVDSVTKHFYDRGWHGINIEPNNEYFTTLARERPRDENLSLVVGTHREVVYTQVRNSGLATVDPSIAAQIPSEYDPTQWRRTAYDLAYILERKIGDNRELTIDFMKVDVEGAEEDVLRSNDWVAYRPRFLCIEAIHPFSREPNYQAWEKFIIHEGYEFVEDDGLNRYYKDGYAVRR